MKTYSIRVGNDLVTVPGDEFKLMKSGTLLIFTSNIQTSAFAPGVWYFVTDSPVVKNEGE